MKRAFALIIPILLLASCSTTPTKPSATGSIYELLVVMLDNSLRQEIVDTMQADMPCLPQMEPYFRVTTCNPDIFDAILKPSRNILIVDVDPARYTKTKVVYSTDVYSHPQAICRIQSPSIDGVEQLWSSSALTIRNWFVRQEISRQAKFYKSFCNNEAREKLLQEMGCEIYIPNDYQLIKDTTAGDLKFYWLCNNGGAMRRDLVVYTYPYTDPNTFTKDFLLLKRDEVMKQFVAGGIEGSYMGTEYKHITPQFSEIAVNGNGYAACLRGLWKMYDGAAMGGPFVSITRLDEVNQRVVTAEVFIFAPGQKKAKPIRQAEAILYTLRLPQESSQTEH